MSSSQLLELVENVIWKRDQSVRLEVGILFDWGKVLCFDGPGDRLSVFDVGDSWHAVESLKCNLISGCIGCQGCAWQVTDLR